MNLSFSRDNREFIGRHACSSPLSALAVVRLCTHVHARQPMTMQRKKQTRLSVLHLGYVFANLGSFMNMFVRNNYNQIKYSYVRTCIHPIYCSGLISMNSNTPSEETHT